MMCCKFFFLTCLVSFSSGLRMDETKERDFSQGEQSLKRFYSAYAEHHTLRYKIQDEGRQVWPNILFAWKARLAEVEQIILSEYEIGKDLPIPARRREVREIAMEELLQLMRDEGRLE